MRLGLFGGSFDPIHHGHLITATRAAEAVKLDRVWFIPAARSPLKPGDQVASARDRRAMLRLALRGNRLFDSCDLELVRGGTSYTIDTLREIRSRTPAQLFLILGADAARLLPRWKSVDEVRRLAQVIIVSRPGDRLPERAPRTHALRLPALEISSTEIRSRVRQRLSVRYLVPDSVERYICRKGLYR